ncbi:hypothetical protein WJX77_000480 [Trebouxia sp. C0004]
MLFCDKVKEYAVILTDLLADLLARPAVLVNSDQHVTGNYMCKSDRRDPSLTACPRLESFVHMLAEHHKCSQHRGQQITNF